MSTDLRAAIEALPTIETAVVPNARAPKVKWVPLPGVLRLLDEAAHRPAEPAPLSDEQILRAFIEKVPAAWFKPEWHDGILAGLRAVIAAHQQPQTP